MKRIYLIPLLTIAFAAATAACSWAQANGQDLTVAFSDPSRPGTVKVHLLQGGISVKAYSGKEVIIRSRGSDGDSRNNRRTPSTDTQGLHRIEAVGSGVSVEEDNNVMTIGSGSWNRSLDLEIQVPVRTNLQVTTVNGGNVTIEGVDGDIEANNNNGGITLTDIAGSVVAHSLNGKVLATLKRVTAQKPMSFLSLNGAVDVTLPPDVKANVKLRTDNGEIWTDFDIQMKSSAPPVVEDNRSRGGRYRIEVDRNILGTINGGGPDFELRSMNGNVYIRKSK